MKGRLIVIFLLISITSASLFETELFLSLTNIKDLIYTAPEGKVVTDVYFYLDSGESVNGTIHYGSSNFDYSIEYDRPNFYTSGIYLRLGNQSATLTDYDLLGSQKTVLLTYIFNENTNPQTSICLIYERGEIFKPSICIPAENLEMNPIWKFSTNANSPIDLKIGLLTYNTYFEGWETTRKYGSGGGERKEEAPDLTHYLNLVKDFSSKSWSILSGIIWYFNLIFIDNGLLTFGLFEAIVLAWSAGTSRNIFSFYRKYIRTHVSLLRFLMDVIRFVADVVYKIVNTLIPI
jgi:hypothetical protein